ncbi:transketolase [Candidatus Pacearchaeota archaeon]|nr:MAG: transketolase [Candidatus Pacearchaeota archaeon]
MNKKESLQAAANALRRDVLQMTTIAGSGHPSSCLSCAEIMACLFFDEMRYNTRDPNWPTNDEFVLSKGHAAPILYSALHHAGCINKNLFHLRELCSPLEGHPMPRSLKWVKVATGSLGQGLSVGVGMALASRLSRNNFRVYVLLGDSEIAEGSVYEAAQLASYYSLSNLCAIVDVNRLGQRGETMVGHKLEVYKKRFEAFGWDVQVVDGHSVQQILRALARARTQKNPQVILAKTIKGKGVSFIEDKNGWHGKALNEEQLKRALSEIPDVSFPKIRIKAPPKPTKAKRTRSDREVEGFVRDVKVKMGQELATRKAYGLALAALARARDDVIAVDAEVSNSTFSNEVKKVSEKQFVEAFVAEQNMIGVALGLAVKGFRVFASTFAAFLTRAHDQIRMAALSDANMTICGSHCGVSIGEDGASQMGLEDIAMFRSLADAYVFYPSDANSTAEIVRQSLTLGKIKYIRTSRPATKVIYSTNARFKPNDFKVARATSSGKAKVVLVGAGVTLHEALKASYALEARGVSNAVVDAYCLKPFPSKKFAEFAKANGGKVVVSEDHYPAGGIGETIASALAGTSVKLAHLAVREIPHSGKKDELLRKYKIDARAIANAARKLLA